MSLAAVRYEAVRVLPPPPEKQDATSLSNGAVDNRSPVIQETFQTVIPNGATVARVTARLSDDDYYVKRVVENPPQPSKKASAVNRYWDISGRKYDGVYPIDFHLVLSGQEFHDGGIATSGRTEMALSVRGAFTSEDIDRRIHDEWRSLRRRVESALNSCRERPGILEHGSTQRLIADLLESGRLAPDLAAQLIEQIRAEFGLYE
ncbi:hypothetical protein [Pseudonocardia charpentierae]|uniref:Uncharacterized protein n=1 Tax=Pseudonocardia charpentierae TaxID=3075545 RepID=A0ABU2NCF1_9PSEU|nr:hypothetical protein [Pseudonocardia sp. DSM 45834]MDT0350304.1 hypothetical protein [Pseudonocardia sp. DSM 45834]